MASFGDSAASMKRSVGAATQDRPKRRKTAVACKECRDRKRKCDGRRPFCGACSVKSKGKRTCTWDPDKSGKFHDSDYVMSLQTRVRQLESMLAPPTPSLPAMQTEHQQTSFDMSTHEPPGRSLAVSEPSPPIGLQANPESGHANPLDTRSLISLDAMRPSPTSPQTSEHTARIPAQVYGTRQSRSSFGEGGLHGRNAAELEHDLDDTEDSEADVDGMGAIASTAVREASTTGSFPPERAYFGPSSTLSFMKHIQAVLQPANTPKVLHRTKDRSREQGYHQASRKTSEPSFARRNYVIPTRELANALLSSYWNHVHPIYPYLFKFAFNMRYEKLWSDPREESPCTAFFGSIYPLEGRVDTEDYYSNEPIFFCLLNLVFALGAQYSPMVDPGERGETGRTFFQRAKDFVSLDSLEHGEVTLVQALLLMGHYLQSTDRSSMCWNIVGLAIRTSQSIGLDKPARSGRNMSRLDVEIRKRLWGGCILQDRVASMMFGRQLMLTPASIRDAELPDGIGEEDLMAIGATPYMQPSIRPSYITFFAHAVKLCQLVGEVLDVVYGGGILTNDTTNSGTFAADSTRESSASSLIDKIKTGNTHDILRLDAELTKWRNELPSFLQIATYTTDPVCALTSPATENDPTLTEIPQELLIIFNRQAKVLQARFLHVKILLSRPVLAVLLSNSDASPRAYSSADALQVVLQQTMLEKISKHCVQAAQDLTSLVYDSLMDGDVTLPAWWYNVFYLYTTATIFVAQRLCPPMMPTGADDQWQQCWDKCLRGLHRYKSQSAVARRGFTVLDLIDKQLFRAKDRAQHTFSASLDASYGGHQQSELQRSQATDPTGDPEFFADPNLEITGTVPAGMGFNLALDAQDMEWLANIPFDANLDIDSSTLGWFAEHRGDHDMFLES